LVEWTKGVTRSRVCSRVGLVVLCVYTLQSPSLVRTIAETGAVVRRSSVCTIHLVERCATRGAGGVFVGAGGCRIH